MSCLEATWSSLLSPTLFGWIRLGRHLDALLEMPAFSDDYACQHRSKARSLRRSLEPSRVVKRVDDAVELALAAERQPSPLPVAVNELTQIGLD